MVDCGPVVEHGRLWLRTVHFIVEIMEIFASFTNYDDELLQLVIFLQTLLYVYIYIYIMYVILFRYNIFIHIYNADQ